MRQHLLVGVQAGKDVIVVDADAIGDGLRAAQVAQAAFGPIAKRIGDGDEANVVVGTEALLGGAGATAAAADQADADSAGAAGVDVGDGARGQGGAGHGGGFQEVATR